MSISELDRADGDRTRGERVVQDGTLTIGIGPALENCLIRLFGELERFNCSSLDR